MEIEVSRARDIPRVHQFTDFRKYLGEWFQYKKATRRGFSHRTLSQKLGLSSPNFVLLVIKGERNISMELAEKLSSVIGHADEEKEYFLWLVRLDQAKDSRERLEAQRNLLRLVRKVSTSVLKSCQLDVIGSWQHMLIRECVFFSDFKPEAEYIAKKLDYFISLEEAEASIEFLIKGQYWIQDQNGQWKANDPVLDTGDNVFTGILMNELHSKTLDQWSKWIQEVEPTQRELGLLYIPINSNKIPELKKRIRDFQDEIIGWLQDEKEADQIVQLGTYLMPLRRKSDN